MGLVLKVIHKVIFSLAATTFLLIQLYWLHGGGQVISIAPSQFTFLPTNDQVQGGSSESSLSINDDQVTLHCHLRPSDEYAWPYCGISIQLGSGLDKGINLKRFHTLKLNIDFEQSDSELAPSMRVYLRNFNPAYSDISDDYTQKYNGLAYAPGVNQGVIEIPIANLQVMTWWLTDNNISIAHSAPEFTNVTKLELATGSNHNSGEYSMTINSIELVGNYVDGELLMLSLLTFWVVFGLVYSIAEIKRGRQLVTRAQIRQAHLHRINEKLKQQSSHFAELANRDALTGAMNRHAIREWLDENFEGQEKPLAILYLDIDFFKQVNDKYGHRMGDDILREFTMVVLSVITSEERFVRWGGEEFVVFCPQMSLSEAGELADKIRGRVESHIWVHGDKLTTSIGVALRHNERVNQTLTRADEALYAAKHQGRNRVVVSAHPDS